MDTSFACNVPSSAGVGGHKDHPYWDRATWPDIREHALRCERGDFDTVAFPDHLSIAEGATFECFTTLAALAEATGSVTIYPKVTNSLFRNPGLLAKMSATLDVIADGRLKMGFGAGWLEGEMTSYGYDWPDAVERIRRMEEVVEVVRQLWTGSRVSYDGTFYQLSEAQCRPTPVQTHPPIAIGGGGEQYTLAAIARQADSWNLTRASLEDFRGKLAILERHCEENGRNFDEIEKSWFGRVVIRESEAEVEALVERTQMFDDLDSARETNLVGTPEQIREQIAALLEVGVDEIVVEFVDLPRWTGFDLFCDEIIPAF